MTLYTYFMNRSIFSEAVVLSSRPFSEADKLITVFSKDFGKLTLLARGVKRTKSRKRGALEVFNQIKFFAHKSKGLPVMTEVEVINNFTKVREVLKRVAVAYFLVEVVAQATREEEPNQDVYYLLVVSLDKLSNEKKLKELRSEFSIKLAERLGFIPEGQFVPNSDELIENIIERKLGSVRVGKKLQV